MKWITIKKLGGILFFLFFLTLTIGSSYAASRPPLKMLLIPMKPPSKMYKNFLPLTKYLEKNLNVSVKITVARKNSDVVKLFRKGDADIAFVCPTLYCDLSKEFPVVPLVKLRTNGKDEYRSVLVVREDSPIRRTADLIDKTWVYGRYNCPGSGLLPRIMLKRAGISEDDFYEVVKLGSDESAILAVMARMFDVTGVPEMSARSFPDKGLRIIRYSDPIPQYLFVARADIGEKLIRKMKDAMLALNDVDNKESLIGSIDLGVDGFSDAVDSDYDIVRVLMESLKEAKDLYSYRKDSITLIVEPIFYDVDLFRRMNPILSYLRKETGMNYHVIIPKNMDQFLTMKRKGEGDLYLQEFHLYSEFKSNEEEVAGSLNVIPPDQNTGAIIVRAEGSIKMLDDLKGKKVGIVSLFSQGGYLSQMNLLNEKGLSLKDIDVVEFETCENVLMNVYHGSVDAGFLIHSTLERLQNDIEPDRIVVLKKTHLLQDWVMTMRKDMNTEIKEKIKGLLERQKTEGILSVKDRATTQ